MYKQAQKIIDKFGGASRLAAALSCDPSAVYKWNYEKERGGTEGLVPSSAMPAVIDAAIVLGIDLTPEDLDPR